MHSKFSDLAYELYADDDIEGAIILYRKAVKEGDFLANMEIARIYIENPEAADFNELIACLKTVAISSYIEKYEASYELAKIYLEKNDIESALKYARQIETIDKYSNFVNKIKSRKNDKPNEIKQLVKIIQHNSSATVSKIDKSKERLERQMVQSLRSFSNINQYNEIKQLIEKLGHNTLNDQRMSRLNLLMAESYYYGDNGAEKNLEKAAEFCKLSGVKSHLYYSLLAYIENANHKNTAEDDALILGNKNVSIASNINSKKRLLVFDLDGTIFDTDFLREKRRYEAVSDLELQNVKYIEGFENMFLDCDNQLSLKNNDVLIITNNRESYVKKLLNYNKKMSDLITFDVIRTAKKKIDLRNFLNRHPEYEEIIGFGDDEIDANIYAELKIPFYIVNNYYGYEGKIDEILNIAKNNLNNFRNNYLYDSKLLSHTIGVGFSFENDETEHEFKYFDRMVVYYKVYLKTKRLEYGIERGSDYCPDEGFRKAIKHFTQFELGKSTKNATIVRESDFFTNLFNDLQIDKYTILCRVPGHDELKHTEKPLDKVLKLINDNHMNKGLVCGNLIYRRYAIEESKSGNRDVIKQLESMAINSNLVNKIKGKTVYLFDDISTSGSSMMACAQLLYEAQVGHVVCFALARTCGEGKYAPEEIL